VAALALMVITMWLLSQRKYIRYTVIPGIFMLATTIGSLTYGLIRYVKSRDLLLGTISLVLVGLSLLLIGESIPAVMKGRRLKER
jgi:carbon starvation protein CstA